MATNSNNGGLLPSAMALNDSLSQKPVTSLEQMMLTPSQQELLRLGEREIDEFLANSNFAEEVRLRFSTADLSAKVSRAAE